MRNTKAKKYVINGAIAIVAPNVQSARQYAGVHNISGLHWIYYNLMSDTPIRGYSAVIVLKDRYITFDEGRVSQTPVFYVDGVEWPEGVAK